MAGDGIKAVTVRLPQDQADLLEEIARVDGVPVAEEVRTAVSWLIDARRRDREFHERLKNSLDRNRRILELLGDEP